MFCDLWKTKKSLIGGIDTQILRLFYDVATESEEKMAQPPLKRCLVSMPKIGDLRPPHRILTLTYKFSRIKSLCVFEAGFHHVESKLSLFARNQYFECKNEIWTKSAKALLRWGRNVKLCNFVESKSPSYVAVRSKTNQCSVFVRVPHFTEVVLMSHFWRPFPPRTLAIVYFHLLFTPNLFL